MIEVIQKFVPWATTLSTVPKIFLSIIIAALAALTLAVIWTPQRAALPAGAVGLWPEMKSLESLKRQLDRVSRKNAALLKVVAQIDQYGIYVNDLAAKLGVSRDEAVYRAKELQTAGLVEVLSLTDLNVRLSDDVTKLLGVNTAQFITAYLK